MDSLSKLSDKVLDCATRSGNFLNSLFGDERTSVDDLAACYFCMICMVHLVFGVVSMCINYLPFHCHWQGVDWAFRNHMKPLVYISVHAEHWWIAIGCLGLIYFFVFRLDHRKYGMCVRETSVLWHQFQTIIFVIWPQTCLLGSFLYIKIHQLGICHLSFIHMCSELNLERIPRDFIFFSTNQFMRNLYAQLWLLRNPSSPDFSIAFNNRLSYNTLWKRLSASW